MGSDGGEGEDVRLEKKATRPTEETGSGERNCSGAPDGRVAVLAFLQAFGEVLAGFANQVSAFAFHGDEARSGRGGGTETRLLEANFLGRPREDSELQDAMVAARLIREHAGDFAAAFPDELDHRGQADEGLLVFEDVGQER